MALYAEIGIVMRALPTDDGLQIKLQTQSGPQILDIPANRPELVEEARAARITREEMLVRRTEEGMVVALQPNIGEVAA